MAAILTFLRYVGSSGLIVGLTMSRVTSNIGHYYRAENTDIALTSKRRRRYAIFMSKVSFATDLRIPAMVFNSSVQEKLVLFWPPTFQFFIHWCHTGC